MFRKFWIGNGKQALLLPLVVVIMIGCGADLRSKDKSCDDIACQVDDPTNGHPQIQNLEVSIVSQQRQLEWVWSQYSDFSLIESVIIQRKAQNDSEDSFVNIGIVGSNATAFSDPSQVAGYVVYRILVYYHSDQEIFQSTISSAVTSQKEFIKVTNGGEFSCGITMEGAVYCWGGNDFGQLGNATTVDSSVPVLVQGLNSGATDISAGDNHVCAIVSGMIKCWGNNEEYQFGNTVNGYYTNVPVNIPGIVSGATKVSAGSYHTCAIVADAVKCWGANYYGQLGSGNTTHASIPVNVNGTTGVTSIVSGGSQSCAIVSGSVRCWGQNNYGQIGIGNNTNQLIPVTVPGTSNATSISAGRYHTCAVVGSGVKCWGYNNSGQLGDGTVINRSNPINVVGLSNATAISLGGYHSCAIVEGAVKCWGSNLSRQLGSNSPSNFFTSPVNVTGSVTGVTKISTGMAHTCAMIGNFAKCWGNNGFGQLGIGTTSAFVGIPADIGL